MKQRRKEKPLQKSGYSVVQNLSIQYKTWGYKLDAHFGGSFALMKEAYFCLSW
jgi:hypothetical protein